MSIKIIIDGVDCTNVMGEAIYLNDKFYIPIDLLKTYLNAKINTSLADKKVEIDFDPKNIIENLINEVKSDKVLNIKIEKEQNGQAKAIANIGIGDRFNASIDSTGKVQIGGTIEW